MNFFPSNKILLVSLLIVTTWFGIKFTTIAKTQFFQLNYDWHNEIEISTKGIVDIDSVSFNYMRIFSEAQITTSPQNTYKLKAEKEVYYFRYDYLLIDNLSIQFKGIEWITDIPNSYAGKFELSEVNLSLDQGKGESIITIGDYRLRRGEAKYFRRFLGQMSPVIFKGRFNDVFNYPHEAVETNTSKTIVAQLKEISKANNYVLFFGSNDTIMTSEEIANNVNEIVEKIYDEKDPKRVFLILLPPSPNLELNSYTTNYNKIVIEALGDSKTEIINTEILFSENIQKYIREDGVSISKDGYYKLAKEIAKKIE
jgi:lysophospholipase L1-like esterase